MDELIIKLRLFTNTGVNDYTVGNTSYWTDEQLQDELDRTKELVNYQSMISVPSYGVGGAVTWTEYQTGLTAWEKSPTIQNEGGTVLTAGTATGNYAFNDNIGVISFVGDTSGKTRYITGNIYNVELAASRIWEQKADYYATQFDFSTDNHTIKRSPLADQCKKMAQFYAGRAGITQIEMVRSDDTF
jgi:hypothetical protein